MPKVPSYFIAVLECHKVSTLTSLSGMNEGQRNTKLLHMRLEKVDHLTGKKVQDRLCNTKQRKPQPGSDGCVAVLKAPMSGGASNEMSVVELKDKSDK